MMEPWRLQMSERKWMPPEVRSWKLYIFGERAVAMFGWDHMWCEPTRVVYWPKVLATGEIEPVEQVIA